MLSLDTFERDVEKQVDLLKALSKEVKGDV